MYIVAGEYKVKEGKEKEVIDTERRALAISRDAAFDVFHAGLDGLGIVACLLGISWAMPGTATSRTAAAASADNAKRKTVIKNLRAATSLFRYYRRTMRHGDRLCRWN